MTILELERISRRASRHCGSGLRGTLELLELELQALSRGQSLFDGYLIESP